MIAQPKQHRKQQQQQQQQQKQQQQMWHHQLQLQQRHIVSTSSVSADIDISSSGGTDNHCTPLRDPEQQFEEHCSAR